MDTLVARYGRPTFEDEGYSQPEQQELSQITPSLSLNFTLPPLANVSSRDVLAYYVAFRDSQKDSNNRSIALVLPPSNNR